MESYVKFPVLVSLGTSGERALRAAIPRGAGSASIVSFQTGQYSQRELIKCSNVTESMGLALFNIFKAINVYCPIWWASVFP